MPYILLVAAAALAGGFTLLRVWPSAGRAMLTAMFLGWVRVRFGWRLGRNLGFVKERLADVDLTGSFPPYMPPPELLENLQLENRYASGPTEQLKRASAWAAVLERAVRDMPPPGRRPAATTYGFVQFEQGVRLSVIHYLRPLDAFRSRAPEPIRLSGHTFPVIMRPWILHKQNGIETAGAGTCWVEFTSADGARCRGILTAAHAVVPERAAIGDDVKLDVARSEPRGRLRCESPKMDAAVVQVDDQDWRGTRHVDPSRVLGYKPVRLLGAGRAVEADVIEHSGFAGGTISGAPGSEPLTPTILFLNRHLSHGDSGCLGLDIEFEKYQPASITPPYLLYQGLYGTRSGPAGYGLMLEQPRLVWGLTFYDGT